MYKIWACVMNVKPLKDHFFNLAKSEKVNEVKRDWFCFKTFIVSRLSYKLFCCALSYNQVFHKCVLIIILLSLIR
jgi:hypothetical protein